MSENQGSISRDQVRGSLLNTIGNLSTWGKYMKIAPTLMGLQALVYKVAYEKIEINRTYSL